MLKSSVTFIINKYTRHICQIVIYVCSWGLILESHLKPTLSRNDCSTSFHKRLNGTCDEMSTGLHPHQPPTQRATVSRELPQRHTRWHTQCTPTCFTRTMIMVKWQIKLQKGESNRCCVYLGDLQQYNTVLDGLYHTLEEKKQKKTERKSITRNWLQNSKRQEGKCVKFWLTQVVSFKVSIFWKKEKSNRL